MIRIRKTLVGLGLAAGLLALPLGAGAQTLEVLKTEYASHRFFVSEEEVWRANGIEIADYAMLDVSDLERIAGRTHLDQETVKFLEDNIWEYDSLADFEGGVDPATGLTDEELQTLGGSPSHNDVADHDDLSTEARWFRDAEAEADTGVHAVDPDLFSDEIPWQDATEPVARFAGDADNTGGVYIDPGYFSNEILGQDRVEPVARFAGDEDKTRGGVYGIDIGFYDNEAPWQGNPDPIARPAQTQPSGIFPHPDDVPQLRAGELNY